MSVLDYSSRATPKATNSVPNMPACAKVITKSDTDTFSQPVHVYVGTAGTVTAVPEGAGSAGTGVAAVCVAGGWYPTRVWAVKSTGTTASDLVGVYD
jgi:hypothetical protein